MPSNSEIFIAVRRAKYGEVEFYDTNTAAGSEEWTQRRVEKIAREDAAWDGNNPVVRIERVKLIVVE